MYRFVLPTVWPLVLIAALCPQVAGGETLSADDRAFFENKIRPVLVRHCYECHAADAKELGGKLLLDSRDGIRTGGESGPALVGGKPDASLIVQALRYDGLEMPPDEPLPESVVSDFVKWVRRGAPDPRSDDAKLDNASAQDREPLWSLQPVENPPLPDVQDRAWPRDPLDRFVLARIEAARLAPTHGADARTLVRRLYYDLTGLPPTLAEVEAFEKESIRNRQSEIWSMPCCPVRNSASAGAGTGSTWLVTANQTATTG